MPYAARFCITMPRVLHRAQARATATGPIRPHTPIITSLRFEPRLKLPFNILRNQDAIEEDGLHTSPSASSSSVTRM